MRERGVDGTHLSWILSQVHQGAIERFLGGVGGGRGDRDGEYM